MTMKAPPYRAINPMGKVPAPERERMMGHGNCELTMNTLESVVSQADYLVGNKFSAADVYVGSHIGFGMQFGTIEKRPAFEKYWARLSARPAWRRANALDNEAAAAMKS